MSRRAIIFDMGDIFFDATPWRRALTVYLQEQGVAIDYPGFCRQWEAKLVEVYVGRKDYWIALGELFAQLGLTSEAVQAAAGFARRKADEVGQQRTLFDGVAETLQALKAAGWKLAVLSDTESREPSVRNRLAEMGIEPYFDAVVTSVDIGHAKPSPEAYLAALERLRVTAAEAVFVGHDEDELVGARAAGLGTVSYNCPANLPADIHIGFFSELPHCLSERAGAKKQAE